MLLDVFLLQERSAGFQTRVHEIARQRLASDANLVHQSHEVVYGELMGEIDRSAISDQVKLFVHPIGKVSHPGAGRGRSAAAH